VPAAGCAGEVAGADLTGSTRREPPTGSEAISASAAVPAEKHKMYVDTAFGFRIMRQVPGALKVLMHIVPE
jgi:hypothetical protein